MNWKLALDIALTHLLAKKRQSLVAMMGVLFGISMFLVMISFMTGVNKFIEDVAMDGSPHIRVYNPVQMADEPVMAAAYKEERAWLVVHHQQPRNELPRIKNGLKLMDEIEKMEGVEGVAPQVATQAFFNNGPTQISGIVNGIDVKRHNRLFNLEAKMKQGSLSDLQGRDAIALGYGLAKKINARLGDRIQVTTPAGSIITLKVAGIFTYGMAQLDETRSYVSLATVQKMLQQNPSYVTDLNIKLQDEQLAKEVAKKLESRFDIYTEDWQTANAPLLAGDSIRNSMTAVVSFTLLLVAGFGIYNIMNMTIVNKMKDIAILKATGFQGKDIVAIFMLQSIIIGVLGGLLGVTVGYGFCSLLSITPFPQGDFFRTPTMPVSFDPMFYVFGVLFGFLTTLFAGYFPALKASKIDPVAIIRG